MVSDCVHGWIMILWLSCNERRILCLELKHWLRIRRTILRSLHVIEQIPLGSADVCQFVRCAIKCVENDHGIRPIDLPLLSPESHTRCKPLVWFECPVGCCAVACWAFRMACSAACYCGTGYFMVNSFWWWVKFFFLLLLTLKQVAPRVETIRRVFCRLLYI